MVHLFGAKSSPACASYALRKVADDNETHASQETLETVRDSFYVDHCLKSVDDVDTPHIRKILPRPGKDTSP